MLNDVLIPSRASDRHAVALVVVLSFLVLITGVVVAFFSLSVLQHQVSHSSASLTSVELFARGALNATVGDVQQEIVDGSTTPAPNQSPTPAAYPPIYLPKTAANAVPAPQGTPPPSGTSAAPGTENLLKRSARTAPFYPNGVTRAAASATTTASVNGRSVPLARWNKPLLMAKASSGSATDLTPVSAFTAPDWILVNNARVGDAGTAGNPTTWNPNMIWSNAASNQTAVVGRYAYTIYDEGGLLDANVAGYPAPIAPGSTTGTNYVYKNAEAFADLTQLGLTQQQINALIGWRNNATMSASGSLPTYSMDLTAAGGQLNYRNFHPGQHQRFPGYRQRVGRFVERHDGPPVRHAPEFDPVPHQWGGAGGHGGHRPAKRPAIPGHLHARRERPHLFASTGLDTSFRAAKLSRLWIR